MDLRFVHSLVSMGQLGKARTLLNWITEQAMANHGWIAELLSDGIYQPGSEDERWQPGMDQEDYRSDSHVRLRSGPTCCFGTDLLGVEVVGAGGCESS